MNQRVGRLSLPLRVLVFVIGLLLAFLVALAVGAAVSLIVDGDDGRSATGSVSSPDPEVSETSTPEAPSETTPEGTADEEVVDPPAVASFVHLAKNTNSQGDYTYLSDPSINGDPDAVVLAEPAPAQGTAADGAYDHNIGVWFEPQKRKWAIFNQDVRPVPAGTAYRVTVPRKSSSFVHRFSESEVASGATASASASASASAASEPTINDTTLDDPLVNGKPGARVSVTQNWNPGGGAGVYNDHPVDIRYDEGSERWVIFNRDLASFKDGAAFNVSVSKAATEP